MTGKAIKRRTADAVVPIGVVAPTKSSATSLADELNMHHAVALSPSSKACRGHDFRALIVDDACWPLNAEAREVFLPRLERHKGYIIRLCRFDADAV